MKKKNEIPGKNGEDKRKGKKLDLSPIHQMQPFSEEDNVEISI